MCIIKTCTLRLNCILTIQGVANHRQVKLSQYNPKAVSVYHLNRCSYIFKLINDDINFDKIDRLHNLLSKFKVLIQLN